MKQLDKELITYAKALAKAKDIYFSPDHAWLVGEIIQEKNDDMLVEISRMAKEVEADDDWANYSINCMQALSNLDESIGYYHNDSDYQGLDQETYELDDEELDALEEDSSVIVVSTIRDLADLCTPDNLLDIVNMVSVVLREYVNRVDRVKHEEGKTDLKNSDIESLDFLTFSVQG